MKRKFNITVLEEETGDGAEHEFRCLQAGPRLNIAISDALNNIRSRLKYCSDEVTETEQSFLEELRSQLAASYIEEGT